MIVDCIVISLTVMLLVWGIDQLLRLKQKRKRTKQEKQSLLISIACVPAYVLMSLLGALLSIAVPEAPTHLGSLLFESAVLTGRFIWAASLVAIIAGLILRKRGNPQAAKLAQMAAMGYIALFGILCVVSGVL